jgi:hypothetical protein
MKPSQFTLALIFSSLLTSPLHASEERFNKLEGEIRDLKSRIEKLEGGKAKLTSPSPKTRSKEGWKDLSNWRSLKKGMSCDDVRELLGEPDRINGGSFTFWYYKGASNVIFYMDQLDSWTEPRTR